MYTLRLFVENVEKELQNKDNHTWTPAQRQYVLCFLWSPPRIHARWSRAYLYKSKSFVRLITEAKKMVGGLIADLDSWSSPAHSSLSVWDTSMRGYFQYCRVRLYLDQMVQTSPSHQSFPPTGVPAAANGTDCIHCTLALPQACLPAINDNLQGHSQQGFEF